MKAGSHQNQGGENRGGRQGAIPAPAVVLTVTEAVTTVDPSRVTEAGEIVQVAVCGAPLQVSDTAPVNPLIGVRVAL